MEQDGILDMSGNDAARYIIENHESMTFQDICDYYSVILTDPWVTAALYKAAERILWDRA